MIEDQLDFLSNFKSQLHHTEYEELEGEIKADLYDSVDDLAEELEINYELDLDILD